MRYRTLTPRQREVLSLRCQGLSNQDVARQLFVQERTITNHMTRLLARMGLPGRCGVVAGVGLVSKRGPTLAPWRFAYVGREEGIASASLPTLPEARIVPGREEGGALQHPRPPAQSGVLRTIATQTEVWLNQLASLAAMVIADQVVAAIVVSPAEIALFSTAALPVLAGPFLPGDHRNRDPARDGESWGDASARPPAL